MFATDDPVAVLTNATGSAPNTTAIGTVDTDVGSGTLWYDVTKNVTELAATVKAGGRSRPVNTAGTQTVQITGLPTNDPGYYYHFVQDTDSGESNVESTPAPFSTGDELPVPPNAGLNDAILIVTGGPTINDGLAI